MEQQAGSRRRLEVGGAGQVKAGKVGKDGGRQGQAMQAEQEQQGV